MILVDTSVWIDHFRAGDESLSKLLDSGRVLTHPFVIGEIALGNLRQRAEVLSLLQGLPRAVVGRAEEVLAFVEQKALGGRGIGYIDAQLLVATRLTAGAMLWTRDKRLAALAAELEMSPPN